MDRGGRPLYILYYFRSDTDRTAPAAARSHVRGGGGGRDRAHRTDSVVRLLDKHGVIVLQGPPHYPRFYGQLERQNRDHRAWLDRVGVLPAAALQPECDRMKVAINERWRRRALGWRTPAEAWALRPRIGHELRDSCRAEEYDRAARIERHLDQDNDLAMRLAIEQALTQRGYLRLEQRVGAN